MKNKSLLFSAAVAGLVFSAGALAADKKDAHAADAKKADAGVHCYGVNACKGKGECGGAGHECAGHNACKGKGWVKAASKEECTKKHGTTEAPKA